MLRRVTDLCFLKMPVNTVQYRVTVGIFNNRKLITNLRFELLSCSKLSNNLLNYDASFISLFFYIFLIAFLLSKGYVSKISRKLYISMFLLLNNLLGVLVWLCSFLIILNGEVNPGIFLFVNLSLEPQQHIDPWLFQIISFEGIYIGS